MLRFSTITHLVSVSSLLVLTAACTGQSAAKSSANREVLQDSTNVSLGLSVVDEDGAPIKGAQVMIGDQAGSPFAGNFLSADANGQLAVPAAWTSAQPVTIDAPGFVRATFFSRLPQVASFQLHHMPYTQNHELTGVTTGFGDIQNGVVEMGLVFPTFTREQLSVFEPNSLLSSESDTFKVLGHAVQIPSNIAIPEQSQSLIFPVTLSKPTYRLEFTRAQKYQVSAVHVSVPMDDLSSAIQNGEPIFNLLNHLTFLESGAVSVALQGTSTKFDIPINQTAFNQDAELHAPAFDETSEMVVMATSETQGHYQLTDAKILQSEATVKLSTVGGKGTLVSVLRTALKESVGVQSSVNSIVVSPIGRDPSTPQFLGLVATPKVEAAKISLVLPATTHGVTPLLTYGVLSKIELMQNGHYKLEKKTPQWELYAKSWVNNVSLPTWPKTDGVAQDQTATPPEQNDDQNDSADDDSAPHLQLIATSMRWEISFAGSGKEDAAPAGPEQLKSATHVTRGATDL